MMDLQRFLFIDLLLGRYHLVLSLHNARPRLQVAKRRSILDTEMDSAEARFAGKNKWYLYHPLLRTSMWDDAPTRG